ncbi:MAG TPA: hypothetical protein IAB56_03800 [Candidatus Scybalousia intestinigallinarum]|nr:hypothetical protein [Candidatus Scybalousia intestinigallinarum]
MLNDYIYLVISPDGEKRFIKRNDLYNNHYEYLQDFSKQDDYLRSHSFGLTFSLNDLQTNLLFFQELASENNIIIENYKIRSFEKVSTITIYLPNQTTRKQEKSISTYDDELKTTEFIFLESYDMDENKFQDIHTDHSGKSTTEVLHSYLKNHQQEEFNYSTKTHK